MSAVAIVLFTLDTVFLYERLCVSVVYLRLLWQPGSVRVVGRPPGRVSFFALWARAGVHVGYE